jgi:hypothetical protein
MNTHRHGHGRGTALITGASGGIGAVYADRLARRGHDVVLVGRERDRLESVARAVAARSGRKAEVMVADLRAKRDLIAVEQRLAGDAGIRVLVTTGTQPAGATSAGSDRHRREVLQQLDAVALRMLSRAAAPAFVARGGGTIVNVAPSAPMESPLLDGSSGAGRAFVVSLSESLHDELGAEGLRVQAVLPIASSQQQGELAAGDVVDAALVGLDRNERLTIPAQAG